MYFIYIFYLKKAMTDSTSIFPSTARFNERIKECHDNEDETELNNQQKIVGRLVIILS